MSDSAFPSKRRHPGKGTKRGRPRPKGRQIEETALDEVRALIGTRARRRDLLIEFLHVIQDAFGHISAAHLAALAEEMRLPMAEVFETATFYAHFDIVREDENPPPPLTIRVCDGVTCEMMGAPRLLEGLGDRLDPTEVRVMRAPCMGRCDTAPVAQVGKYHVDHASVTSVSGAASAGKIEPDVGDYIDFQRYVAGGGYQLFRSCLAGTRTPEDVIAALDKANLRGLGGAGFPAARKWEFVRREPRPRLFALNADEGEPGTFKDRFYLERDPHRVIEGMLIACWAIEAENAVIYLRDEYPGVLEILHREIAALERTGITPRGYIRIRRGAGAYICGEESAMLESIEGKRGLPRHKPPYPAQVGLFGRPTLIHNVETMSWIRDICDKGVANLRSFSVSGRVRNPGVKVAPAGITVRKLIDEYSGGIPDGHTFTAYLPGGASGGILPASKADLPLDFGTLEPYGCFVGSHAVIVLSDRDDVVAVARNLMAFFEDESCGQCTPCRVGTEKASALMAGGEWDESLLRELTDAMRDASICGLGQAAPNPMLSVLNNFRQSVTIR